MKGVLVTLALFACLLSLAAPCLSAVVAIAGRGTMAVVLLVLVSCAAAVPVTWLLTAIVRATDSRSFQAPEGQ